MLNRLLDDTDLTPQRAAAFERAFWWTFVIVFGVRTLLLVTLPLDLSGDETYYWEWGRHLAWGYYSKPPGIGWLMALAGWLGANTTFGIRFVAVVLGAGSAACIFLLGKRAYNAQAGFLAAVAFMATPAAAALSQLLTIDAPLVFFWCAALLAFWIYVESTGRSTASACFLAIAIAGGVLSKQMMLVFPAVALLYLALSEHRPLLARPSLWLALLTPLLALVPPLWWNAQHGWVTFTHTMHHFNPAGHPFAGAWRRFLEFAGSEAGLVTPVGYLLVLIVCAVAAWRWRMLASRERFLLLFSAPGLLVTLLMTLRQTVNANWPAVYYLSAAVLLAGWAVRAWNTHTRADRLRIWCLPGLWIAVGLTLATYGAAYLVAFRAIDLGSLNPLERVQGWRTIARQVQEVREEVPRPGDTFVLTVSHRYLASELAFYLPGHPEVLLYHEGPPGAVVSQYDLWPSPASRTGGDALIVVQARDKTLPPELAAAFEEVRPIGTYTFPRAYRKFTPLKLYLGRNLLHYPEAAITRRAGSARASD